MHAAPSACSLRAVMVKILAPTTASSSIKALELFLSLLCLLGELVPEEHQEGILLCGIFLHKVNKSAVHLSNLLCLSLSLTICTEALPTNHIAISWQRLLPFLQSIKLPSSPSSRIVASGPTASKLAISPETCRGSTSLVQSYP